MCVRTGVVKHLASLCLGSYTNIMNYSAFYYTQWPADHNINEGNIPVYHCHPLWALSSRMWARFATIKYGLSVWEVVFAVSHVSIPPSLSLSSVCVLPGAPLPVAVWHFTTLASSSEIACSSAVFRASCQAKHLICVSATGFSFTACSSTLCLSTTMLLPAASKCVCSACLLLTLLWHWLRAPPVLPLYLRLKLLAVV